MAKSNKGNTQPRTPLQIQAATRRMLFDNPLKKPVNQLGQSNRMVGNEYWKQRKKGGRIKQEPSVQVGMVL